MSAVGALIEGATMPAPGLLVRLVRGGLTAAGTVAWAAEGRCGLSFSGTVDVPAWLAPPANKEQQRVDDVVRLVKAGAVPLDPGGAQVPLQIAEDLSRVSALLELLGNELARDDEVVERYAGVLQNLDIAAQTIAAIESLIEDPASELTGKLRLRHLRRSAVQALGS